MNKILSCLCVWLIGFFVASAHGELVVIETNRGVIPTGPYRTFYEQTTARMKLEQPRTGEVLDAVKKQQIIDQFVYPFETKTMKEGAFESFEHTKKIHIALPFNVCLIDNGSGSRQWLDNHYSFLSEKKTACALIKARSKNELIALQNDYPAIYFYPVRAEVMTRNLKIKHYPALIGTKGVTQDPAWLYAPDE